MNGENEPTSGASPATNGVAPSDESLREIAAARERFAAGADDVRGVRPEILVSWYRCREEYEVSPHLERAPAAAEGTAHSIEHDVVLAELGGLAVAAAREVDDVDGLVTVGVCDGRILASWGSRRVLDLAAESNLAAWSAWSSGPAAPTARAPPWSARAPCWSGGRSTGARASTRGCAPVSRCATSSAASRWQP